jgi:myo-inositol-1(or 4)-monophosphatase
MKQSFEYLKDRLIRIADRELPCRFHRAEASRKADGSLVTEADLIMQQRVRDLLQETFPGTGFLAEEMGQAEQQARLDAPGASLWVLDPLDGTSNFSAGLPIFGVSLALISGGRTRFGLVYDPARQECFHAERGKGAWLNGRQLSPETAPHSLAGCLALVDFKRLPEALATRLVAGAPFGSQRNLGSVALELCWLATGRAHLYLHGAQKLWDHAAGLLILREAGGHAVTLEGDPVPALTLEPRSTAAALDRALFAQWTRWLEIPLAGGV